MLGRYTTGPVAARPDYSRGARWCQMLRPEPLGKIRGERERRTGRIEPARMEGATGVTGARIRVEPGGERGQVPTDRLRPGVAQRDDVVVPRGEVLGAEPVRQDEHPEGRHLERRIARVRRDHQGQADGRGTQQVGVAVQAELPDRRQAQPAAQLDRRVRLARGDDRPALGVRRHRDPRPQPVDDEREAVAWLARPAVDDDPTRPLDGRSIARRLQGRGQPWLEREGMLERDPLGLEGGPQQVRVEDGDRARSDRRRSPARGVDWAERG